jgi:glucose-6-phosphate isomerase
VWRCRSLHLRELIADERRVARLQIEDDGILLDYSRQRLTTKTVQLLLALAQATGLQAKIRAMAAGEEINYTERRPVLHMALRAPRGNKLEVGGVDVVAQVHALTLILTLTL